MSDILVTSAPVDVTVTAEPVGVVISTATIAVTVETAGVQGPPGPTGPRGADGTGASVSEQPTGSIDAVNQTFTTAQAFVSGSTRLYLNGMRQSLPSSYTESGSNQLDLSFAPYPGDELIVDYTTA